MTRAPTTVLVVPDGAADPLRAHEPTSLERAATPTWDALARDGAVAAVRPIPAGLAAGTEVGLPTLLGVRLAAVPARGRIEAAAAGVDLAGHEAAWRLDAHPAAALSDEAVAAVDAAVADLGARVVALAGHRMLLIGPAEWGDAPPGPHHVEVALADVAGGWRDVVARAGAALRTHGVDADAWPWGHAGAADELGDLPAALGRPVQVVSGGGAGPGLARRLRADLVSTDLSDAAAVLAAAPDGALVVVHDPRPDAAGHARDADGKVAALAAFDAAVLAPVAEAAARRQATLVACADHGCDPATGRHTDQVLPAVAAPAAAPPGAPRAATERGIVGLDPVDGACLLDHLARPTTPSVDGLRVDAVRGDRTKRTRNRGGGVARGGGVTRGGGVARVVVAAPSSGAGKTTVATGLMAALADRGLRVAGGKVGPDYIDPSYHRLATGRPGATLDAALCGPDLIAPLARHHAEGCDALIVEGVMGLFDGIAPGRAPALDADAAPADAASTAHVARLIDAPVILVVDAAAASTSVAATVHGFATFDPNLRLAGVIANRVGSPRHAELVADAVARTGVPLLGCLPRADALTAPGRHLGLVPAVERAPAATAAVAELGAHVAAHVDLDAVMALARTAPAWTAPAWTPPFARPARARVGVAGGPAFSFAYPDDLTLLEAAGAELAWFDPTVDPALPAGCDGLLLSGGFPEVYAADLAANGALRADVAALAATGAPVRAECGGLAYLTASLDDHPMCGVLPARARMTDRLTLGYRRASAAVDAGGWARGEDAVGHEFHYGAVEPTAGATPAWQVDERGAEGFVVGGVHASYLHTCWPGSPHVADRFVAACASKEPACA